MVVPFAVDAAEATPFTKGSHRARLKTYYQSAIATFGTIRRFNPALACVFATNAAPPDWVSRQFQLLDVQIRHIEAASIERLPPGTRFRTSLYLFDALRAIVAPPGEAVTFLDPDVVCIRPFDFALEDGQVGCLPLKTGMLDSIKGTTLVQIAEMRATLGHPVDFTLRHIGGEILTVTQGAVPGLLTRMEWAFAHMDSGGAPVFLNEEHVLTYASDRNWSSMHQLIARIWTLPRYREVPEDPLKLALWHLPAEKTGGLKRVYRAVRDRSFDELPEDVVRRLLGRWTGVTPTRWRLLSDWMRRKIHGWEPAP